MACSVDPPRKGDRVQVVNTGLLSHGKCGVVRLLDRHGKVWLWLDGYRAHQLLPFLPQDLKRIEQADDRNIIG